MFAFGIRYAAVVAVLACLAGCGSRNQQSTTRVKGMIVKGGKPVPTALGIKAGQVHYRLARTDGQGGAMGTEQNDGSVAFPAVDPGTYKVIVYCVDVQKMLAKPQGLTKGDPMEAHDEMGGNFSRAKSPITITVPNQPEWDFGTIDLDKKETWNKQ